MHRKSCQDFSIQNLAKLMMLRERSTLPSERSSRKRQGCDAPQALDSALDLVRGAGQARKHLAEQREELGWCNELAIAAGSVREREECHHGGNPT